MIYFQVYKYMKGHLKIRFRKLQSNMYFSDIDPLKDSSNEKVSSKLRYFGKYFKISSKNV